MVVREKATGRLLELMDHIGGRWQARPLNGGRERDLTPEELVVLGDRSSPGVRLAVADERSRRGALR
ncbi:hypothetical protein SAMN05421773_107157 [Streptomyces aidingensis]|uniref:Uncharacterized protein n=2 Tax=Streptomyces aidingensis TaxID=910347 RepID=A0A1I1MZ82_9ACTN|nr:hypothetical protein SAMN05421773_107157 [Streptomyces aidingensis]